MPLFWGVDSFKPANTVISRRSRLAVRPPQYAQLGQQLPENQTTIYDEVESWFTAHRGEMPERWFWGRYLNPSGHARAATLLRADEIRFIFGRSNGRCKIAPVYNGIDEGACEARDDLGYRNGYHAAQTACLLANRFGIPTNVRIYADIEGPWRVTSDWINGWWDAMYSAEYVGMGGIYGRGAELGRRPAEQTRRALQKDLPRFRAMYPRRGLSSRIAEATGQYATRSPALLAKSADNLRYVWTNMPRASWQLSQNIPNQFLGLGPYSGATTVIWQYGLELRRWRFSWTRQNPTTGARETRSSYLIDENLATEQGYHDMWAGSA